LEFEQDGAVLYPVLEMMIEGGVQRLETFSRLVVGVPAYGKGI
jgi:hypothetical protein